MRVLDASREEGGARPVAVTMPRARRRPSQEDLDETDNAASEPLDTLIADPQGKKDLSLLGLILLTISLTGVQFTWTVELAYGTPYLVSLTLPKSLTALVWLAGPLSGLLIQPIVGVYSDRCRLKMGRRRPFMIFGGILVLMSIAMIAYSREMAALVLPESRLRSGTILVAVTGFYFLDFSINAVQASCRSLIVDTAPLHQQETANAWAGRMIGVGNVIGYFMGFLDLVKFFPWIGGTQMQVLCWLAGLWFTASVGATCWYVNETPLAKLPASETLARQGESWYLPMLQILHALRRLPKPLQRICNVQFFAWVGLFPFLFYSTTWVGLKAPMAIPPILPPSPPSINTTLSSPPIINSGGVHPTGDMDGTRAGSFAMLIYSIVSLVTGVLLPLLTIRTPPSSESSGVHWIWRLVGRIRSLPGVWAGSMFLFGGLMAGTFWVDDLTGATILISAVGISWGTMQWVPFVLLGEIINTYAAHPNLPTSTTPPTIEDGYANVPDSDTDEPADGWANETSSDRLVRDTNAPATAAGQQSGSQHHLEAGMVLGIHNIYIVLPQFVSTLLCSILFAILGAVNPENPEDESDPGDAVGWVLRTGTVFSIIAGILAWRVPAAGAGATAGAAILAGGGH
ncbi:major facilitator superfamily domain-containing protein [Phlyctochytrium arcticum]|nr:major facilitator superfamily domain-containing protein [Phlyctochytrium arcticum]